MSVSIFRSIIELSDYRAIGLLICTPNVQLQIFKKMLDTVLIDFSLFTDMEISHIAIMCLCLGIKCQNSN